MHKSIEWILCLVYFNGECAFCGRTTKKHDPLHLSYINSLNVDGKKVGSNIIPVCSSCAKLRKDKDIKEWFLHSSLFSQNRLNKIFSWRAIMQQAEVSR